MQYQNYLAIHLTINLQECLFKFFLLTVYLVEKEMVIVPTILS